MWLLFGLCLILSIFSHLVNRRKLYPAFVFSSIWSFITFLVAIRLYDIDVNDKVFNILLIMIICFPLGCYFCQANRQKKIIGSISSQYNENISNESTLNKIMFWGLCGIAVFVMILDEATIIRHILSGNTFFDIIQMNGGVNTVEISGIKGYIYIYIVYPVTYLISPICATEFFLREKERAQYLIINFAVIFLAVMHHGARLMIIITLIVYVSIFRILEKKITITQTVKRILWGIVVTSIVAIIYLSISRGIDEIVGSFYMYFVCGIPVLDSFLKSNILHGYTYGFLSFNGVFYPFMVLLRLIGFEPFSIFSYAQKLRFFLDQNWVFIQTYGHGVNAFLPAGGSLYIDGGYVFEGAVMFLTGWFCEAKFEKLAINKTNKKIALYSLIIVAISLSFFRFYLMSYQFVIAYIYIQYLYSKKRSKR